MPTLDLNDLDDSELAATAKAVDVHRQSLVRKLQRISDTNPAEQARTLAEIQSCSSASAKMRRVHDAQLAHGLTRAS